MSFDFSDEDLMAVLQIEEEKSPEEDGWKMYFDGASNALGKFKVFGLKGLVSLGIGLGEFGFFRLIR